HRVGRFVDRRSGRTGRSEDRLYLAVEKILGAEEALRRDWPVDGTTGYDFIARLSELFVDPAGARPMQRIGERLTGRRQSFDGVVRDAKAAVIDTSFPADLDRLTVAFRRLARNNATRIE